MAAAVGWVEVSTKSPCPICGHDHWCRVSRDGATAVCRRVAGGQHKVDRAGLDCWVYRLRDDPPPAPSEAPLATEPECADAPTRHAVYSVLLDLLDLSPAHRDNLRHRGLPDADIAKRGYRTLPSRDRARLARALAHRFGRDTCLRVPGLYLKLDGGRSWLSVAGWSGLVIPVRDVQHRVIACSIRLDEAASGGKYRFLSSKSHDGPGPGAPIHLPLDDRPKDVIAVVEGALKADVVTALWDVPAIGLPGVGAWRQMFPVLAELGTTGVRLLFDADAWRNPDVGRSLKAAWAAIKAHNLHAEIGTWT